MALSVPRLLPTKTYPFSEFRHMLAAMGIQPGVVADEFKVVQRAAGGANKSVDVSAADLGAWIKGLDTTRQGIYHVFNDAVVNLPIADNATANPRIDQIVIRIYDSSVIGGGQDQGALEVIQGAPTAGAQAKTPGAAGYRAGAADLTALAAPKSLIRLADIEVVAGMASITNANIVDRRPWARGGYRRIMRTSGNYNLTTVLALVDPVNLQPRIECTGAPIQVTLKALGNFTPTAVAQYLIANLFLDGVSITDGGAYWTAAQSASAFDLPMHFGWTIVPAAGSHQIGLAGRYVPGTAAFIYANATNPLVFEVQELVRQNADNS